MIELIEKIKNSEKILIITHPNPDGDTLGSACALKEYAGKKADILIQTYRKNGIPTLYDFLFSIKESYFLDNVKNIYDLVICVDVASFDRIVESAREIFSSAKTTVNIDHHKTNKGYADINFIKAGYSSTGEVLFDFFTENDIKITKNMAEALYVAILTDTGSFRYESVTPKTFEAASTLAKTGIDTSLIAKKCYDKKPKKMVQFQADVISNAKYSPDDRFVAAIIPYNSVKNIKNEYTEGIAETLRSVDSVEISAVLKEQEPGVTKVSLRSKTKDLTEIIQKFNGGGHKFAAGCTVRQPAQKAYELIRDEITKCLKS